MIIIMVSSDNIKVYPYKKVKNISKIKISFFGMNESKYKNILNWYKKHFSLIYASSLNALLVKLIFILS